MTQTQQQEVPASILLLMLSPPQQSQTQEAEDKQVNPFPTLMCGRVYTDTERWVCGPNLM